MNITRTPGESTSHPCDQHPLEHPFMPVHRDPRHPRPHHIHAHPHAHVPPGTHSSRIRLEYDETTVESINRLFGGNTGYVISQIESCLPEIKLTLAIILGIKADLTGYAEDSPPMIRFDTAFMTEQNATAIAKALDCEGDVPTVMSIYNNCPPEQAILAIAAALAQSGEGA